MSRRDLYRILGVPRQAAPGEIKRAYRRIAFSSHPDVGAHPDTERFREAHEAYATLSDPARRRSYDTHTTEVRRPGEPLRAWVRDPILNDRVPAMRSIEELLGEGARNLFRYSERSRRRSRRISAEVILDIIEAQSGCRVPLTLPACARCPTCDGSRERWDLCPTCYPGGVVGDGELILEIPRGAQDGDQFEIYLGKTGIEILVLRVRVRVT